MNYNPNIHPLSMILKSFIGKIEFLLTRFNYPNKELIVVNYHSTPGKFLANFESQVIFFKKYFNIITPHQFEDFYAGKLLSDKPSLLFTFDDGLKNNESALKILEKNSIKAYFFIVPEFIDTPHAFQKEYYIKNIRPHINPLIDSEDKDFEALSWDEIKKIKEKGHAIGSHTYTHTLLAATSDQKNSEKEILESKAYIEKKLGSEINSFCSINNTLLSANKKEKDLINKNYAFHFTTIPGLNSETKDALFVKRRNIESFWLKGAVCYSLGKFDLSRWKSKIREFIAL